MFSRFLAVTYSPKALFIHENADLRAILHVLALKTSKIKIGPCVSPLPFYVPSQLANLAACVDVLSRGRLVIGPGAGRNKDEAEQYIWGIGEGAVPELMGPIINEKIRKGIKLKMLGPEGALDAIPSPSPRNVEMRGLSDIPVIIGLTEEGAAVCFCLVGGRTDYAGFSGKDPVFLNWVKDLFLYYWDKGKRA